jgi:hypothetical protein
MDRIAFCKASESPVMTFSQTGRYAGGRPTGQKSSR